MEQIGLAAVIDLSKFTGNLNIYTRGIKQATDETKKTASALSTIGAKAFDFGKFTGKIGIAGLATAIGAGTAAGFEYNNMLQQASARIQAFTKDSAVTAATIAMIRTEAAKTPFTFGEMVTAAGALQPVMKASGESLKNLIKDAEILAASNPLQGLEGASFALREAVSGDFTSIIERFNLSRVTINRLKAEGVPALEIVRQAMAEMGFDAGLVSNMAETMEGRWSTFSDTMINLAGTISQPMFDQMSESLGRLNTALEQNEGSVARWAGVWTGVTQTLADGLDSWTYVLLDAIPAIEQHKTSLAQDAAQALLTAQSYDEAAAATDEAENDVEAFQQSLIANVKTHEEYQAAIDKVAESNIFLAGELDLTTEGFAAAKIAIQQENVELRKNEGATYMASYAASRLAAEQFKLTQSAGASSQALAAVTARYQGLANAERTMTDGHSFLERMAGGETLTGPEAEQLAESTKAQEKFAKQSATAMTKSFDEAANDLRSTIESVIKPSLSEVWQPAGQEGNIDEWARRVATVATSGFSSEWLTAASQQFGGQSFFQPIMDAMQGGDEGALKAAANDLLTRNVTALWDVETIKARVRQQLQEQNLRQQIIDQVQAELSAEGVSVSPESVAAVAGGATQAAGGMNQANQATADMGLTAGTTQTAIDNLGLTLDTITNVKIVALITKTGELETTIGKLSIGVTTASTEMITALTAAVPKMEDVVKMVDWEQLGASIDQGIAKGITENELVVMEKLKSMAKEALKQAGDAIGYGSPAAKFFPLGASIPQGVAVGIGQAAGLVQSAFDKMFNIDRSVASDTAIAKYARQQTEHYQENRQFDDSRGELIRRTLENIFKVNGKEILKTADPVAEMQRRLFEAMPGYRGADITSSMMTGSAKAFINAALKGAASAATALQKIIVDGSQKAIDFAGSLVDVATAGAQQLNGEIDMLAQLLNTGASEFMLDGQIYSAAEATDLLNAKMAEQAAIQDDLLQLQQSQNQLNFLEKQLGLIETISKAGLNPADVLSGADLSTVGGLVGATNAAIRAIIGQVGQDISAYTPVQGSQTINNQAVNLNMGGVNISNGMSLNNLTSLIQRTVASGFG